MAEDQYSKTAQLFHLLSHEARLRILDELRRGDMNMVTVFSTLAGYVFGLILAVV